MSACGTADTGAHRCDPIQVAATNARFDYSPPDSHLVAVNQQPVDLATAAPRSVLPAPVSSHHSTTDPAGTSATTPDRPGHLHSSNAAAADPFLQASGRTADPEQPNAAQSEAGDNPGSCTS